MIILTTSCVCAIVMCLLSFYLYGNVVVYLTKVECDSATRICIGVFCFFLIFSMVAIPCILCYQPFDVLYKIWTFVWLSTSFGCCFCTKGREINKNKKNKFSVKNHIIVLFCLLFLFLFFLVITSDYIGADGLYYIKVVAKAAEGNAMYLDGGRTQETLIPHYALGSYYMFIAYIEKLTGLTSLMACKIIAGGLCFIIASLIVFSIGKFWFNSNENGLIILIIWMMLNLIFVSIYTPSTFLMLRAYEAKSWCGNVIYPMLFLAFFFILEDEKNKAWWWIVLLIAFSGNFLSMSATMGLPAFLTIFSFMSYMRFRKGYIIKYYMVCCIPLVSILFLIFFVEAKGFVLGVF